MELVKNILSVMTLLVVVVSILTYIAALASILTLKFGKSADWEKISREFDACHPMYVKYRNLQTFDWLLEKKRFDLVTGENIRSVLIALSPLYLKSGKLLLYAILFGMIAFIILMVGLSVYSQ